MNKKIAVIGAGNVGASCAMYLAEANIADVILVDIVDGIPQGKGLDLSQAGPVRGYNAMVNGTNKMRDIKGADIVIMTAGLPRKPGMSREDLIKTNADIVGSVGKEIKKYAPKAFVIVVSNPLDLMTYHMQKATGFPKNRVMGQAGVLDSTRMRTFIAMELGVDGVLMNTGVAGAKKPVLMAEAMRLAVESGRKAFLAGRIPMKLYATASSPLEGTVGRG